MFAPAAGFQEKVEGEPETCWQSTPASQDSGIAVCSFAEENKILNTHVILNSEGEMVSVYRSLACTGRGRAVRQLGAGVSFCRQDPPLRCSIHRLGGVQADRAGRGRGRLRQRCRQAGRDCLLRRTSASIKRIASSCAVSLEMPRGPISAAVPAAALRTRSSGLVCTGLVLQDPRSECM